MLFTSDKADCSLLVTVTVLHDCTAIHWDYITLAVSASRGVCKPSWFKHTHTQTHICTLEREHARS